MVFFFVVIRGFVSFEKYDFRFRNVCRVLVAQPDAHENIQCIYVCATVS